MSVELHETEIDGVRCFWVDTGRPTLSAQLTFRQGMADETLNECGWLHLLEHLCLHGRGGGALQVNGSVSLVSTEFSAHGPIDQVSRHLAELTGWLASPDLGDLERERDVLRAEARLRGGAAARALGWRYGAKGPGLANYDDPALGRVSVDALAERAGRVFTSGNAALALDGPPPAGLRLRLPTGSILPAAEAVPCDNGMAAYVDEGGLVLSGVVARSESATTVPQIVHRALRERLRDQVGGAYAPWADYQRVDSHHAVVLAGSDVSAALLPSLTGLILDLVARFASDPVPTGWLDEIIAERLQAYTDPHLAAMVAWRAASMWLIGDRPETHAELLETTRNLNPQAIQADLAAFCDSLLLGLPGAAAWHDELPMLTFPADATRDGGRRWRHREWPADTARLCLDGSRIAVVRGKQSQGIPLSSVAGLYCYPDGGRSVVSDEGWGLAVEPDRWRDGGRAVRALDEAIPADLHLPQPERTGRTPFRPAPWPVRWWRFVTGNPTARFTAIGLVLVGLMIGPALAATAEGFAVNDGLRGVPGLIAVGIVVAVVVGAIRVRSRS